MSGLMLMGKGVTPPPWTPCARTYAGNMCGTYTPALPPVPGGAANPDLVLSWFLDRYDANQQARIRANWNARRLKDVLVSWPDSRAMGATPESFVAFCVDLRARGFEPAVMLCSKNYDPSDVPAIKRNVGPVLALLKQKVGRICVGWELSLWLSPTDVQALIDWMFPQVIPWGGKLYVHFQEGYFAFQQPGGVTADFWNLNIGKLTGILHQKVLDWDMAMYQARIVDCLERFAGRAGFSPDSGFGHPWDFIALEITATFAFNDNMSESDQNAWATDAYTTPGVGGPEGVVSVMGSGNGVVMGPRVGAVAEVGMHPALLGLSLPYHPNY